MRGRVYRTEGGLIKRSAVVVRKKRGLNLQNRGTTGVLPFRLAHSQASAT